MKKCTAIILFGIMGVSLVFSCQWKGKPVCIPNLEYTDSISYKTYQHIDDSIIVDSIVIKDKYEIQKVLDLLQNHTFKVHAKFASDKRMTLYIKGAQENISISKKGIKGIKYNGEYMCDVDVETFMENLLSN